MHYIYLAVFFVCGAIGFGLTKLICCLIGRKS
jgi:hypothetical protein